MTLVGVAFDGSTFITTGNRSTTGGGAAAKGGFGTSRNHFDDADRRRSGGTPMDSWVIHCCLLAFGLQLCCLTIWVERHVVIELLQNARAIRASAKQTYQRDFSIPY